mmetsp:Transcript_33124/g.43634  ORF Transcript_33124/g.43634 Transcript_33124/m.43634 type:complete len:82 (-) Transcript_33124:291-536(-)
MGINPGLFSAALTKHVIDYHEQNPSEDPVDLVKYACEKASEKFQGSATLVALTVTGELTLNAANLGDSGYALFHVLPEDKL